MDDRFVTRFWAKVDRRGADECWPWRFGTDKDGYGKVYAHRHHARAHRVAFSVHNGVELTAAQMVCHHCDNPRCCNPAHLFLGDPLVNMRDKIAKARANYERGEQHHQAKLTDESVRVIRERLLAGDRGCDLASEYGVSRSVISNIKTGKKWVHLP